jgi:alpha-beta hydrolase superfamily lysophospholipase
MRALSAMCCGAHAQAKDKTFRLIPGRWHVLLKEPGNRDILQEVIAWLDARL